MKDEKLNFEEQITKLEQIVEALDEGELPLDDLMDKYKEGMQIAKGCRKFLDSAQQKIVEINDNLSSELKDDEHDDRHSDGPDHDNDGGQQPDNISEE